jgi:BolA family transcriptional regulator, general stress-responsive regulator
MDFFDTIKEKINRKINAENITLIDNSSLHAKHKFFDPKKFHLKIIIQSEQLKKMNKIDAHREIFYILSEEIKTKIHALELEVK